MCVCLRRVCASRPTVQVVLFKSGLHQQIHDTSSPHAFTPRCRTHAAQLVHSHQHPARRSARGQTIAIVDVGSTSLKLLVATLNERTGSISALHEEKRQVKLLSGARFSHISPEATERALAAFGHFCAVAAQFGVPLQAMATSGLRDADRADELIHKVQHKVRNLPFRRALPVAPGRR